MPQKFLLVCVIDNDNLLLANRLKIGKPITKIPSFIHVWMHTQILPTQMKNVNI